MLGSKFKLSSEFAEDLRTKLFRKLIEIACHHNRLEFVEDFSAGNGNIRLLLVTACEQDDG